MTKSKTPEAPEAVDAAEAPAKSLYRVRDGFVLHPRDGSDAVFGGTEIELTAAEAEWFAVQIEAA